MDNKELEFESVDETTTEEVVDEEVTSNPEEVTEESPVDYEIKEKEFSVEDTPVSEAPAYEEEPVSDTTLTDEEFIAEDTQISDDEFEPEKPLDEEVFEDKPSVEEATPTEEVIDLPVEEVPAEVKENVLETAVSTPAEVKETHENGLVKMIDGDEKSYKPNIGLLVTVPLIAMAIVLCAVVLYLNSKPSLIFKRVINDVFLEAENRLDSYTSGHDSILTDMKVKIDAKSSSEEFQSVLDLFNKLSFKYIAAEDLNNGNVRLGLTAKYNDEDMLDAEIFVDDKNVYIDEKNLFEKPVYMPLTGGINTNQTDLDSLKGVVEGVRVALNASIKDKYITKDKDGNLTVYKLDIDSTNVKDVALSFVKSLKNNSKFQEAYAKYSGVTVKDVKTNLEDYYTMIDNSDVSDDVAIMAAFYMSGNKLDHADFVVNEAGETTKMTIKVNGDYDYNIIYTSGMTKYVFDLVVKANDELTEGIETIKLDVYENDENVCSFIVTADFKIEYDVTMTNNIKPRAVNLMTLTEEDMLAIDSKMSSNKEFAQFQEDLTDIINVFMPYNFDDIDADEAYYE